MAEEGLSTNSDWTLVNKEKSELEKLQINFENLQKIMVEEKEKSVKLENELKEMNKQIEKNNIDNENKNVEMKQYFQKLIDEISSFLKQKDEEIKCLKEENKKITADNEIKIGEIKQNCQKLIEESIKKLQTENDFCFKQKDEKIKFLEVSPKRRLP